MIEVGQVYASTHSGDVKYGRRQRRRLVRVEGRFAYLVTEDDQGSPTGPESRVSLRADASHVRTIPGHRLVPESAQSEGGNDAG